MSDANVGSRQPVPTNQPPVSERVRTSQPDRDECEPSLSPGFFQLSRGDQLFVGTVACVALVMMGIHWVRLSGWGMQPVEIKDLPPRKFDYRIDINRAELVEWIQLGGIGETLATRILEDRRENGPFTSIDDLQRVNGIGPKTVEKLRPWLMIDSGGNDGSKNDGMN